MESLIEQVNRLLETNAIRNDIDYIHLVRTLEHIPRCHTLPMNKRGSVAGHILNTLYLLDFFFFNGFIEPDLEYDEYLAIHKYCMYHDVEETLMGDIPFFAAKAVEPLSEETRKVIAEKFGADMTLDKDLLKLAKLIDIIDFILTIQHEDHSIPRIHQAQKNAVSILDERMRESKHKIRFRDLL